MSSFSIHAVQLPLQIIVLLTTEAPSSSDLLSQVVGYHLANCAWSSAREFSLAAVCLGHLVVQDYTFVERKEVVVVADIGSSCQAWSARTGHIAVTTGAYWCC